LENGDAPFNRARFRNQRAQLPLSYIATAIEAWRETLPERQRKRLIHPLSNVRRWRAATGHSGKCPGDLKREAMAAWKRFVSCVSALPENEATSILSAVQNDIVTLTRACVMQ
jgi:hypothetical protein